MAVVQMGVVSNLLLPSLPPPPPPPTFLQGADLLKGHRNLFVDTAKAQLARAKEDTTKPSMMRELGGPPWQRADKKGDIILIAFEK
jgi:hypothetical protein